MRFTFFLLSTVSSTLLYGQKITGYVKDAVSRQPLASCSLVVPNARSSAVSGLDGSFTLVLHAKTEHAVLLVTSVGYVSDTVRISGTASFYEINLQPMQNRLEEVVVTGVSKATLVAENPVAVIAISHKAIEQTIEENTIDAIAKNAPGLQTVKTGPNVSKPFINGMGYNRVLTLYDGLRVETQQWGDEHGVPMDDYIVGRAEVIEGPASLMYGSDAIAGVLSIFPETPQKTDKRLHGKFLSEYQDNNGLIGNNLSLMYGGPHWSYALRGSRRIARNYTDPVDGRVYNTGFSMVNASAFAGYQAAKGYFHLNLTFYDNRQGIPDGSRDSLTRRFTYQIYESPGENILQPQVDTIKKRPLVPAGILNSYRISPLSQRIQDYRLYADHFYQLNKGDIKTSLGFEQNARREYNHPTEAQQAGEYIELNTLDYAVRYNAPAFSGIEPSIGIGGMYQSNLNKNATDFPIPDYRLFDFGSYLYAKWKKGKWTIAGGLRYDHRDENGREMYTRPDASTGFYRQVPLSDSAGGHRQFAPFRLNFQGVTGSTGFTYRLNDRVSFKANIARGYRAPNITEIASNGLDPGAHIYYIGNLNFRPEFSLQEDIGVLASYPTITFNAGIFYNYIRNYIYEDQKTDQTGNPIVIIPGNKTFQYQQTNAVLYGLNAVLNVHPATWKAFHWDNSFSLVYGYNLSPAYKGKGNEGAYLPFLPPPRLLSSVHYEFHAGRGHALPVNLKVESDYNAAQNHYLGLYGTETPTAAYVLLNVMAGTEIAYSGSNVIQLQFAVNNLLDASYQSHLSRLQYLEYYTSSPNGHRGIYNMGRNICAKVIWRF